MFLIHYASFCWLKQIVTFSSIDQLTAQAHPYLTRVFFFLKCTFSLKCLFYPWLYLFSLTTNLPRHFLCPLSCLLLLASTIADTSFVVLGIGGYRVIQLFCKRISLKKRNTKTSHRPYRSLLTQILWIVRSATLKVGNTKAFFFKGAQKHTFSDALFLNKCLLTTV